MAVYGVWQHKRNNGKGRRAVAQERRREVVPQAPGSGAEVLHGIRVIDLSTVVAGPSCAAQLGVLGAEVFKVESPKGDMWRKMLLEFERGRPFSSLFEAANFNKSSVVIDLKSEQGLAQCHKLLAGADVIVTNMRSKALEALGMTPEQLHKEYPSLVIAHLTAFGHTGPECELPGYDIGAFWGCSGISAAVHDQWEYSTYPIAFGDTVTGSLMLAGIVAALHKRLRSGRGSIVRASLLHSGMFCNAAQLVDQEFGPARDLEPTSFEAYELRKAAMGGPLCAPYLTKDGKYLCLLGSAVKDSRERLERAGIGLVGGDQDAASLKAFFGDRTLAQMQELLKSVGVPFCESRSIKAIHEESPFEYHKAGCFAKVPGNEKIPHIANVPFDVLCSKNHRVISRAPLLGAQTDDILEHGWSEVHPEAALPTSPPPGISLDSLATRPLDGVTVVEFSAVGLEAAACCQQLLALGARIVKVSPRPFDPWQRRNPALYEQFNKGKTIVKVDMQDDEAVKSAVYELLQTADAFVTNVLASRLRTLKLDKYSIQEDFPTLCYSYATALGQGNAELETHAERGPFWDMTGLSQLCGGALPSQPSMLPPHLGSVCTSMNLLAATCCGLFHRQRAAEGCAVTASLLRAGLWQNAQLLSLYGYDPLKYPKHKRGERWSRYPVPTANCHRTKDGMWLQLLGVDFKVHIPRLLKALGIRSTVYSRLVWRVLTRVVPDRRKVSLVEKLSPVMELFSSSVQDAIGRLTYAEVQALFEQHDIWYCCILLPEQVARYRQAHAVGCVQQRESGPGLVVPPPLSVKSHDG